MENNLKAYREKLNLTQTEFAEEVGIDRESYCKIENGKKSLGLKILKKVFRHLKKHYFPDLHMEDLLVDDE